MQQAKQYRRLFCTGVIAHPLFKNTINLGLIFHPFHFFLKIPDEWAKSFDDFILGGEFWESGGGWGYMVYFRRPAKGD